MKEHQVEFIFVGIIILGFAIWKISEMVKTRCYQKQVRIQEGFAAEKAAATTAAAAAKPAATAASSNGAASKDPSTEKILSHVNDLLKKGVKSPPLSTENFTVDTSEHEMTIHQRKMF